MSTPRKDQLEYRRLREDETRAKNWKRWGPYLSERQWGTVREDYSADGEAWDFFSYDQSRLRAYRWGEDGLLGFTDRECRLCFAPALWNEQDPHLKERLFGLTGPEGNHGEDVKELYFYLDSLPTHAYAKALYKYPQAAFPYDRLREEARRRGLNDSGFEIEDSGVFNEGRYFDLLVEYAKRSPNDLLIRIRAFNRGPEPAPLHLLPMIWFRNTWVWGCEHEGCTLKPSIKMTDDGGLVLDHSSLDRFHFWAEADGADDEPNWLFTENESNTRALWGYDNYTPYVKDGINRYIVETETGAVNPEQRGTKVAPHFRFVVLAGESVELRCRLSAADEKPSKPFGKAYARIFEKRIQEADAFYESLGPEKDSADKRNIQRQAYAGLLWTKQFYHFSVNDWLNGDPGGIKPPVERLQGRNKGWKHFFARDVLSMPDKWEYPWFAAWDLAFHMIPFCRLDPHFAKHQLTLLLREWYMHPNGQISAYEWNFNDVNPPVHAWAVWRVYKMTGSKGKRDTKFLKHAFLKLLLNFTWWVNRKDESGDNLFSGGFLGLDNIGAFDRSTELPGGAHLQQADGTAWMAFYCTTMLSMALELARTDDSYDAMASKFFEHFMNIADAMNTFGESGLWNEADGFYNDRLKMDGNIIPIRIRSLVGLIPLLAVEVVDDEMTENLSGFKKRMQWFLDHRKDLRDQIAFYECGQKNAYRHLLAIPSRKRLERVLRVMLDEDEFLSPYGIRSLSKYHEANPFNMDLLGEHYSVHYTPGESDSWLFGGNSNWRGPVWMPLNYLLIEALEKYHYFYGDDFNIECPTGSGNWMNLKQVAQHIEARLAHLFQMSPDGDRPIYEGSSDYRDDPHFQGLVLFHEYFHADTGKGIGASHQTGWTALIAEIIDRLER
ncbi:MAG: glucosidase [Verrucomicrobia bacterium]|nr:glucosidase [Verrucomicrobiota bacterium]